MSNATDDRPTKTTHAPVSILSTHLLEHALARVRGYARGTLLDVGCGTKPYASFFDVERHVGVDWPSAVHDTAADVYSSAEVLPFASDAFDTVLCTEVIEHLRRPHDAVDEMARVLRPGGHLILSAPFVHEVHEAPFDFFRFTPFGLVHLLESAGLRPVVALARGSRGHLLVDQLCRLGQRYVRAGCRRLRLSSRASGGLAGLVVGPPQRLGVWLSSRRPAAAVAPSSLAGDRISLGYVVVAAKPDEAGG